MSTANPAIPSSAFTTTLARRAALDLACLAELGAEPDMESLCYDDLRMLAKGRGGTLYDGIKRLAGAIRGQELELAAGEYRMAGLGLSYLEASLARGDRPPPARPA
jgi:hypothetical protein